jgi:hypothetical protein
MYDVKYLHRHHCTDLRTTSDHSITVGITRIVCGKAHPIEVSNILDEHLLGNTDGCWFSMLSYHSIRIII